MKKLIFIDVDGTLVDYENKIPETAIEAIRRARENGHKVYISTGRSKAEIYPELWDIGLDGMIGGNGSYVEDNGKVLFHKTLTLDEAREIVEWFKEKGLDFYIESNSGLFASPGFEEKGQEAFLKYMKLEDPKKAQSFTIREAFPEMIFNASEEELIRDDINKISFILGSYQDYLEAKERFPELKVGTWGGKEHDTLFGDIGIPNISKGKAVEILVRDKEADIKDTIAFGDGRVDIPMLEVCQVGVAMGNGDKELKKIADLVTADVDDNGLYKAFIKLNLV